MSNDSEKQPPSAAEYESTIRSLHRAVRQAKREAEATVDNHHEIVERLEATHRCVVDGLRAEIVRLKDAEVGLADLVEVRRQVAEDIDIAVGESVSAALKRSRALAAETISSIIEREAALIADRDAGWREAEQLRARIGRIVKERDEAAERVHAQIETLAKDFNVVTFILSGNTPTEEMIAARRYDKAIEVRRVFDAVWALVDVNDAPKGSMGSRCLAALDSLKADRAALAELRPKLARLERASEKIHPPLAASGESPIRSLADMAAALREYLYEEAEYSAASPAAIVGRVISRVSEGDMWKRKAAEADARAAGMLSTTNRAIGAAKERSRLLSKAVMDLEIAHDYEQQIRLALGVADYDKLPRARTIQMIEALVKESNSGPLSEAVSAAWQGKVDTARKERDDAVLFFDNFIRGISKALQHDEDAPVPGTSEIVAEVEKLKREHTEMVSERSAYRQPRPSGIINLTGRPVRVSYDGHRWTVCDETGKGSIVYPTSPANPKSHDVAFTPYHDPNDRRDPDAAIRKVFGDATSNPTYVGVDPASGPDKTVMTVKVPAFDLSTPLRKEDPDRAMLGLVKRIESAVRREVGEAACPTTVDVKVVADGPGTMASCEADVNLEPLPVAFEAMKATALSSAGKEARKDALAEVREALGYDRDDAEADPMTVIADTYGALREALPGIEPSLPIDDFAARVRDCMTSEAIDAGFEDERPSIEIHIGSVNIADSGGALKALGDLGLKIKG